MRVLVISPHMDDEVLGAGGVIQRHVERKDEVTVCVVANRVYKHRMVQSAVAREKECTGKAQKVLGYQCLEFLNLPDEKLDKAIVDILIPLEKVYAKIDPKVVYTCHGGDINQDHQAVFKASLIVCRPLANPQLDSFLCYEVPSSTDQIPATGGNLFTPNEYVVLTEKQVERKGEAIKCYDRELKTYPHPRSILGITVFAMKRGMEIGSDFADSFMSLRDVWRTE